MSDRNFDDLAARFAKRIYGGSKGVIRQAVIRRDLDTAGIFKQPPETMLDAGGGFGWVAQQLAPLGTQATVVDISPNMLAIGEEQWLQSEQTGKIHWVEQSIQDTAGCYPLVCCHAVLEWVETPEQVLDQLCALVDADGILSLMVFNEVALIWKHVLYGRIHKAISREIQGFGNTLTPNHAFTIEQMRAWLHSRDMTVEQVSGVRVFHDYMSPQVRETLWQEQASFLELELQYSLEPNHQQMARYLHFVCRKTCTL